MGVGETSLLVTFLAIPVLLEPADGQYRTSRRMRFLELDVKDHSGLTLLL